MTEPIQKTLTGPGGLQLRLDAHKFHKNDPGMDTPALVTDGRGAYATYNCASTQGELDGGRRGAIRLTERQLAWLNSEKVAEEVEAMYDSVD